MSEPIHDEPSPVLSAGAQLRAAREARGMHIGLLATTLKVPVRKLELLEGDRLDELHDATFVRALALSVCRVLKCESGPVLEALPAQEAVAETLEQVGRGMNAPFSQRSVTSMAVRSALGGRGRWVAGLILLLAGAGWWMPASWWSWPSVQPIAVDAASPSDGQAATGASGQVLDASTPQVAQGAAAASSPDLVQTLHGAPAEGAGVAMPSAVMVTEPSWIEVADLQGRQLWARTLTPGEVVALEGGAGVKLTIGNAAGTQVRWRNQAVDLTRVTRDNVARLELQ